MKEDERQMIHIGAGVFGVLLVELFGVQAAIYLAGIGLLMGLVFVQAKLTRIDLGPVEHFLERFERPGVTPGYGALTLAAGALAILTMLSQKEQILASLIILGFGDAGSNIVGRRSLKKLSYNRKKTVDGTLAFVLFSLPAILFAGPIAIPVAALAALAESLESDMDDNLVIAVACIVGFSLLGG